MIFNVGVAVKKCKSYIKLNNSNDIIERTNNRSHVKDSAQVFNRQQLSNVFTLERNSCSG